MCEYGHGRCTAPDTMCPHLIGTFCELDEVYKYIYIQDEGKVIGSALKEMSNKLTKS